MNLHYLNKYQDIIRVDVYFKMHLTPTCLNSAGVYGGGGLYVGTILSSWVAMLGSLEHFTSLGGSDEPDRFNKPLLCSRSLSGDDAYDKRKEVIGKRKSSDKASSG